MRGYIIVGLGILLATTPAAAQTPDLSFLDVPARPRVAGPTPTPEMTSGLRELERELTRFDSRVRGYRATVDALLERRAREERRAALLRYAGALADERQLSRRARARAIRALETFVRRHPDAPDHTPRALLRLAELYLERSLERAGDDPPDLAPTIRVTRRVLTRFSGDPRADRAAYLLGWALAETSRPNEAVRVWRSSVCPDRFRYPDAPREPEAPDETHPAMQAVETDARPVSPYAGCRAAHRSPLEAEMWLRIGEHHFDASEMAHAIDAYTRVVQHPEDRLYPFGLYKLAWSEYRAAHYPEAVERFAQLVRYSDEVRRRTGAAGSDLREEALQYLALTLAYDDWNEDGRPDHTQGGPHPLERLEDTALWPHDAPFAPEVYRRVGDVLFEMGHPDEAIVAWRMRLGAYARGCDTPDVFLSMVRAQRQLGDEDAALATLDELATAVHGRRWRDLPCPGSAARAERMIRRVLLESARLHHDRAQQLRQRALVEDDAALLERANATYGRAVRAYDRALAQARSHPDAYAVRYDRAEALYWSGRYREAARAYATVRDSPFDDRLFARAARRVVESYARLEERAGVSVPEDVPEGTGAPRPQAVPEALHAAARAREIYVRWVRPREDEESVRDAYAFNNARLLYVHGHWDEARRRFARLFDEHCAGPRASDVGRDAWWALEAMAVRREDLGELERLTSSLRTRSCTFAPEGAPALTECEEDGSLSCEVREVECSVRFVRLRAELDTLESEPEAQRARRAESLAARFVQIVECAANHEQAGPALLLAARLLDQHARRPATATRVYQRVVDEIAPRTPALENVVAEAHFQLARAAQRSFDYERALSSYATIVDSERFARSQETTMVQRRRDALVNAALLTARLGRHADAADAWTRAAGLLPVWGAREARLRAAEERLAAGQAGEAREALEAWLRDGDSARARLALARAHEARGDESARRAALAAAVAAFESGDRNATDRSLAAEAALALARAHGDGFTPSPLAPGPRPTVDAFVRALGAGAAQLSERARPVLDRYEAAVALGRAESSVTALERQGDVYERLVRAVLQARFTMPRDVARRIRRASPSVRAEVRAQIEDAMHARLDELVRPLECRAIERYALSSRLATRASLPTLPAQRATERLVAYGTERVRECLDAAHERDATFAPYQPGELDRARAGVHPRSLGAHAPGRLETD